LNTLINLAQGFSVATDPMNLLFCLIGVVAGVVIGALPGLGPTVGISVLLPLTFGMKPVSALIMLCGIYYGTMYGGSISSILINTPGDSAAIMTTLDGYPMAKKGLAGKALGMAAIASVAGGTICVMLFMYLAPALASYALRFGPPEYFALMVLGLTTISGMTGENPFKGYLSALAGLFLASIGLDLVQGVPRFTFGVWELYDGIDFVPVAMGLFGIAEIIAANNEDGEIKISASDIKLRKLLPSREDFGYSIPHILRGTALGFFIGVLPGAGATIASFLSYGMAKKISKRGDQFGSGVIEGVAAPESANNAASMGAMVPLLTLGVPGSGSTAIMLGALLMLGLQPGPLLFQENPDFVWGLIGSMYIGNVILLILALSCVPLFVKILKIPKPILNACVLGFIIAGSYSLSNSIFTVSLTIFFGAIGFVMKRANIPAAPMVLALVLGNMLESSLRRSMILSGGNPVIFFERPLSGTILVISILALFYPIIQKFTKKLLVRA
jgi:putative tricarboxylic transport membrane protein